MEHHYTYLKEKPATAKHYHYQKCIYLTTTDGLCQSYLLSKNHIKNFLSGYVAKLDHEVGVHMHFNLILTSLVTHALVLDVDYSVGHPDNQSDIKKLYQHAVQELKYEMTIPSHSVHKLFEAYVLTREGSQNFHLIFPYVYLNRLDYAALIAKLKHTVPDLDLVHGWMLHQSTKRVHQPPYHVVGQYNDVREYMLTHPDLDHIMKAQYPRKSSHYIYTHVLFPADIPWFKQTVRVSYPIRISQQLRDDATLILSYLNTQKMITYYLYHTSCSTLSEGDPWEHNLFVWIKTNQEQWQFRYTNPIIDSYFKKFYPPLFQLEMDDADEAPLAAMTQKVDQLDEDLRKVYLSLNYHYSIDQFLSVIQDYKKSYQSVLEKMNTRYSPYTTRSLVYELSYRYGQTLDSFPDVHIGKKLLLELRKIFLCGETENFIRVVGFDIMRSIPLTLHGRDLHLFSWENRKWKKTVTTSAFASLLLNGIVDYLLNSLRDENQKEECRKTKGRFLTDQRLEALIQYNYNHTPTPFDENPWLIGLWSCHVLDLKRGVVRLAIPEDYVQRNMKYGFDYPDVSDFHIFLQEAAYREAFENLKAHALDTQNPRSFCYTGYDYVDLLFSFMAMIFCEDYGEMRFFLEFLAWGLIGRNPRRWILFMCGDTSNAKTSLVNLVQDILHDYSGTLSANHFYHSQRTVTSGESPNPELASKLNARFAVIEEVSPVKSINVQALNYFSGNNRLYARQLYKSGRDFDIQFKMIFVMNGLPNLVVTPSIRQRLHVLKFKSSFPVDCTVYDFDTRVFPQKIMMSMHKYGPALLSLLIHLQADILHRPSQSIQIPHSVIANLAELALKESSLTKFETTYVILDSSDSVVPATDIFNYIHYFKSQAPGIIMDSVEHIYDLFCEKHRDRRVTAENEDGFRGMSLQSKHTKVK